MMDTSGKSGIWISGPRSSLYGGRRASGGKTRLLIVDDHEGYRQALASTFSLEPDIEVAGQASNGEAAIEQAGRLRPDVVLMDVNMPGMNGMEATRQITDAYTGIIVVVLTMYQGEEHLREARRAGASAYVMKDAGTDILLQTIRDVMHGQMPLLQNNKTTRPLGSAPARPPHPPGNSRQDDLATGNLITSNERAILELLAEGLTNDEIAQRLGWQLYMVRTYLAEISRKLGLTDRAAVAEFARTRLFNDAGDT
jgi:DNA-binding NarL/FixJ family response regulator